MQDVKVNYTEDFDKDPAAKTVEADKANKSTKTEELNKEKEITKAQIEEWKALYGHVFKVSEGTQDFIFRPLKRSEYTKLMIDTEVEGTSPEAQAERLSARQARLCEICILYPYGDVTDMLEDLAGLGDNLAEYIMAKSGFNALSEPEEL